MDTLLLIPGWLWLLACLAGLAYTVWRYQDAKRDLAVVHERDIGNGRLVWSQHMVIVSRLRAVAFVLWALAAVVVLVGYPLTDMDDALRVVVRVMLTVGVVLIAYTARTDRLTQQRMVTMTHRE